MAKAWALGLVLGMGCRPPETFDEVLESNRSCMKDSDCGLVYDACVCIHASNRSVIARLKMLANEETCRAPQPGCLPPQPIARCDARTRLCLVGFDGGDLP
jgi:hypothetical protein